MCAKQDKWWKNLPMVVLILVAFVAFSNFALSNVAHTGRSYYSDVNEQTEGGYEIYHLSQEGAWHHIADGVKFKPDRIMTVGEVVTVFRNLYGEESVSVSETEVNSWNEEANVLYVCNKISEVAPKCSAHLGQWTNLWKEPVKRYMLAEMLDYVYNFDIDHP